MAAWYDSGSGRSSVFSIELVDVLSLRCHQGHIRIHKNNSEPVLQQAEHEVSALQEESFIDVLGLAENEIAALVPVQQKQSGPSTSQDEIELHTSTTITTLSPFH